MTTRQRQLVTLVRPPRWRVWPFIVGVLVIAATLGAIKYERFYYHVTAQEASREIARTTFAATIRGGKPVNLLQYQQHGAKNQPLIFFTSGDGGWSPFCADIAAHLATKGYTVVAFDVKNYLTTYANSQQPVTPEELGRDYADLLQAARQQPGVDAVRPVTLSGWSLGAGYSVLAATDAKLQGQVARVVGISLPIENELAWKPTDSIIYLTHGVPHEKIFDAHDYLSKLSVPLILLNATDDDTSPLSDANSLLAKAAGPKQLFPVTAHGHHFEGGEEAFYQSLDLSLTNH